MWLSSSSVGRKFIMALTGACLVLFVTFHCLMNSVAIIWPTAYNTICEILGANWYALVASAGLAVLVILHIIYAVILTLQNRKARGSERYAISRRPKTVEWSSQNMFVLGVVILAFLVVHLIQFWAKMQLAEITGCEGSIPPAAGTLFLQVAFSEVWTPIVYIIGFIALWFHMNHGFWSMFQSVGWDNAIWIPRLKKIACWWVSIVIALFVAQAIVFTVMAHKNYYLENQELRNQYKDMVADMVGAKMGENGTAIADQIKAMPYDQVTGAIRQSVQGLKAQIDQTNTPEGKEYMKSQPEMAKQLEMMKQQYEAFESAAKVFDFIEKNDNKPELQLPGQPGQPY